MTYALRDEAVGTCDAGETRLQKKYATRKHNILHRIVHSISAWDQELADREVALLLARSGGRLTDDLERRIMQHRTRSNWGLDR